MIQNNYLIAGTTGVMYNVELQNFFDSEGNRKTSFNGLTDIGFRYKKVSDSNWTIMSIITSENLIPHIRVIENGEIDSNHILQRYGVYKGHIYPCRVLIKGLTSETSYIFESYYIQNGITTYYNRQETVTLSSTSFVSFSELQYSENLSSSTPDEEFKQEKMALLQEGLEKLVEILNMFCPVDWTFNPCGYYQPGATIAGLSGMDFNIYYGTTVDYYRSTAMHEAAHNLFIQSGGFVSENDKIKFMEFATSIEGATWKNGAAGHNYPVLSSARYSYMDDCLVAAACWLSQQN